ncbi:hypothetical protein AB3X96_15955 [Paraburkholderia sp. BR13439]|uniref:hypothetical protein n=1 Tax=Paraburkholderia sp. BR13439 TaxID=3236996 RepID=UPI0034CF6C4F
MISAPICLPHDAMQALDHEAAAALVGNELADGLLMFAHEALRQQRERILVVVANGRLVGRTPGTAWAEIRASR